METLIIKNVKDVKENSSFFAEKRKFEATYSFCYAFLEEMQQKLGLEYEKVNDKNRVLWNSFVLCFDKLNDYYNLQKREMMKDRDRLYYSAKEFSQIIIEGVTYTDILCIIENPINFDFKYDYANLLIENTFKQTLKERKCHAA